jgi:chemotaxis protein MotB
MKRRGKEKGGGNEQAVFLWMLTLVDVMTLLLTFFVVLVSLSSFDELSQLTVLDSIKTIFGTEKKALFPLDTLRKDDENRYGLISNERDEKLENIRKIMLENEPPTDELRLSQNGSHIFISVNNDLMFEPGRARLSLEGKKILIRLAPYLRKQRYPMLIAGHSSLSLEEDLVTASMLDSGFTEQTWALSMERAAEVYGFFAAEGVALESMRMEAYGEHRPRFPVDTPAGRRNNRRVDLVLDKRNELFNRESDINRRSDTGRNFYFKDFRFDLTFPRQR